jgi:site-specific DNA-methyltransferase (adenine-specific)
MSTPPNALYFGDNIDFLGDDIKPERVDLVYLDPPFNSNRAYNVIYKTQSGKAPASQLRAFGDTWHWDQAAVDTYNDLAAHAPTRVRQMIKALREFMVKSSNPQAGDDMLAYLVMMTARLIPLHRVLKPTGSLYLHCDPTASHYLKVVLDTIFGTEQFRSEITWQRTNVHSDSKSWSAVSDIILYYVKDVEAPFTWNPIYQKHSDEYIASKYRYDDHDGRGPYTLDNMTSPNPRPNMMYEWHGHAYPPNGWRYSRETMAKLDEEGRIWYPGDKNQRPRLKRYLNEMRGTLLTNVWTDIDPINSQAKERLGFPTQKPLALLERIIQASSNPGDVVLDPFCGCGTAVVAAQKLDRRWIGIDITFQAIDLIRTRLHDMFDLQEGRDYTVYGVPRSVEDAEQLATLSESDGRWQFQSWALSLVGAQPEGEDRRKARKGADAGIDGRIPFQEGDGSWHEVIISVKSGKVDVKDVRELAEVLTHNNAPLGVLITLRPPTEPMRQWAMNQPPYVSSFNDQPYPRLQILTIQELLDGKRIAMPPSRDRVGSRAPRAAPPAHQTSFIK